MKVKAWLKSFKHYFISWLITIAASDALIIGLISWKGFTSLVDTVFGVCYFGIVYSIGIGILSILLIFMTYLARKVGEKT